MHLSHGMMIPPLICYHFYALLVLGAVFGGATASCLAFLTLYGVGGVELVLGISLFSILGFLLSVASSTWAPSRYDLSISSVPYRTSSSPSFCGKGRRDRTELSIDTFVLNHNEEMISVCSCCPICLNVFEAGDEISIATVCHHAYHSHCLKQWLIRSTTCPYCRQDLEIKRTDEAMAPSDIRKAGAWGIFEGIFDSIYS